MTESSHIPLNERLYRTEAIVLHRMDYGEADRIVTIFTPARGKIRIIVKGARKPLSKTGPHVEFFARSSLLLAKGRDLDVVSDAATLDAHEGLRTNLEAFGHASHIAEILNRLTEDRQENARAYRLLSDSLRLLSDGIDPWLITRNFEWTMLGTLGYRPELYRCVSCGDEMTAAPNAWSSSQGGVLCPNCRGQQQAVRPFSLDAQKIVRLLDREGLVAVARVNIPPQVRSEVEMLLADYLSFLMERDLQSLRVLRSLESPAEGPA
ncbi:MAG: DNA repair protein RecO [Chloroflexota bacterium]